MLATHHFVDDGDLSEMATSAKKDRTGIFATSDVIAQAVLRLLSKPQYSKVRRRLRLIGFGGEDLRSDLSPFIATIRQDYYEIGREAVHVVQELARKRRRSFGREERCDLSRRTDVDYNLALGHGCWTIMTKTLPVDEKKRPPEHDSDGPGRLLD